MIATICICGAGTMGAGIAQTAAQAGFRVLLYDSAPGILSQAEGSISLNLLHLVEKNRITIQDREASLSRIRFITVPDECRADLVIEAIVENLGAKLELFRYLSQFNKEDTILASNTSSLSLKTIAENTERPARVAGMHFFNPAPLMKLVELVFTEYTDERTRITLQNTARKLGKTAVICRDSPGFIVNRVARPYYLEALALLEKGQAGIDTIDAMMEATGFKMGPFRLMDLIGNDINFAVSNSVYQALGCPQRLRPSPVQEQKLRSGELGRKTSRGYYSYPPPATKGK